MRDAVRSTITDLRQTNLSIERFVPQAFLAIVGKPSIVDVELGDNKREKMSVLFSDIRSFTTLSESMTPDENFAFINAYLERMGPVIRDHDGFIDKYIGDAIMALFDRRRRCAARRPRHARHARPLQRRASGGRAQAPIAIGVGINTGILMLGTIGEKHRMDGTVISDAVNLAARVESLTKDYGVAAADLGVHVASSSPIRKAYDIRPIDVVVVKGKTRPVTLFEVYQHDPPTSAMSRGRTRELLAVGRRGAGQARRGDGRALFRQCLDLRPATSAAVEPSEEVRRHGLGERRLTWQQGREVGGSSGLLSGGPRRLVDRLDVDLGAVDDREAGVCVREDARKRSVPPSSMASAPRSPNKARPAVRRRPGAARSVTRPAIAIST